MSKATDEQLVQHSVPRDEDPTEPKRTFTQRFVASLKQPGSAIQIIIAASVAIIIGLSISTTVTEIPEAVPVILEIPGDLWLRALQATSKLSLRRSGYTLCPITNWLVSQFCRLL